jgi:indole-3-glycerol phosphate synthase
MSILKKIINNKKIEIIKKKKIFSINKLVKKNYSKSLFKKKIKYFIKNNKIALITEIKKASPSKGIIKKKFNPLKLAISLNNSGACCLSVLTDKKFFKGNINYIKTIKKKINIPILAKDFFVDPYQVYQAKYYGADCILILLNSVTYSIAKDLYNTAMKCGLDVITEVHNEDEMKIALKFKNNIIGINNRNLNNFKVDINNTIRIYNKFNLKNRIVISESGFNSKKQINLISSKSNIRTFLIGESLMKSSNIAVKIRKFL